MDRTNHENRHLRDLLRRLLEAETGEDSMICHDGGFRYSGDFMSMESALVEPASILTSEERHALIARGYIAPSAGEESATIGVTDEGRNFALGDSASL